MLFLSVFIFTTLLFISSIFTIYFFLLFLQEYSRKRKDKRTYQIRKKKKELAELEKEKAQISKNVFIIQKKIENILRESPYAPFEEKENLKSQISFLRNYKKRNYERLKEIERRIQDV